jgi:transcriptional regulator with XRE-family HTH domain
VRYLVNNHVREVREKVGLKQRELAEMTHLPQSLISDLERGTRKVWGRAAARLSEVLGVPVDELFPEEHR